MNTKILLSIVGTGLLIVGAFFALNSYIYSQKQIPNPDVVVQNESTYTEVTNEKSGLTFSYRSDVTGYELKTLGAEMSGLSEFVTGYQMTSKADLASMAETPWGEGPATIDVRVYKNNQALSLMEWAQTHAVETNIEFAFELPTSTTIAGEEAIVFKADGLYASNVYLVENDGFIIMFTGWYVDESDIIVTDFKDVLTSVRLSEPEVDALSYTPQVQKPGSFRGMLEEVNVGCFVDGECYVVVDEVKVTVVRGWSSDTVGKVIGVDGFGDLESFIGEEVEVYANDTPQGTKTLYGSEDYYVKLVASAGGQIRIGETSSILGVSITPNEVLEDSRCPLDVTCVWAGTVRVSATLVSGLGKSTQEFALGVPVTTEAEEITLVRVDPVSYSAESDIEASEYSFFFKVSKR